MKTLATFVFISILCVSRIAHAADNVQNANNWHQWRGPLANGVAPNGNPPTEWSTTKNVKWKVAIPGRGSASPIVWGDRIFILTSVKTDRTATPAKEEAAANDTTPAKPSAFDDANLERTSATFALAQNDPPAEKDRPERREPGFGRRGPGGPGGPGGRRFGGRGRIEAPSNFYQFNVMCIDRNTGKTIWEKTACEVVPHEGHHQTGTFASSSPYTDGKRLWASFGSRGIYCYDLDGNEKWSEDLGDFKMRFSFGEGSSPAVYGDTLVQICDQETGSFIVALDANTGKEKWRKSRDEVSTWATPLIVEAAGHTQVITSGSNRVRSYDLKNGDLIWECGGLGSNPIACPVVVDNLAIAMTGHDEPAGVAVPLDSKGDVTDKAAWRIEDSTPYVPSPVVMGDTIYFTKSRGNVVSSIAAKTGEYIINQKRLPDIDGIYASPVAANGRIYFSSREGTTVVVKHDTKLDVVATNHLDETIDASPAIVGKDLIIRTEGNLYCISE